MNRTEAIRAAIVLFLTQALNALVLTKVVQLDAEQLAAISAALGTATTLFFLVYKSEPTTSDPPVGTVWTPPHG